MPILTRQKTDSCHLFTVSFLLCASLGLSLFCPANAQVDQSGQAIKPLEGGIDQSWTPSDRVPLDQWKNTIAPRLQQGVKWSDNLLPRQNSETFWMLIPAWLAGQWQTENASFISAAGGRIGESASYLSRHADSFGCQRDSNGAVWHLMRFPTVSSTQSGDEISFFIDLTMSGNAKNTFHVNFDVEDLEVIVNKSDKRIQCVRHRHDTTSWIKIGPIISVDDLMIVEGSAAKNGTIRSQPKLVAPFKKVDKLSDGYDVKESLHHFLVNNGNAALLPLEGEKKSIK